MMIDIIQEAADRTNSVFLKGNIQKVNDFPFDKVYFGATTKMTNPMELDGPLFVSPYPGIASIFAVRPKKDALVNKYNIPAEEVTSRDYDKWRQKFKDELMKGPVKELTVILGGVDFQPIKDTVSGYLHEITITDELRDHIYKSDRMHPEFEFCLYKLDKVPFSKITNVTVNMTIVSKDQYMNKPVEESVLFDDITDDVFVESSAKFDSTMKACKELHEAWSKFDYGIPIDGKIKNVPSAEYFKKNYRFLSPEDFEKYGGGVCWDFVEWGAKFLRDRGIQFHQYYIQSDTPPNYDTHTFLLCKCGKQYIYPESAFGIVDRDMGGVGVFDKFKDVVEYITSMMFECNGNKSRFKEFKYSVQEFYRVPAYGSTCGEYMDFMKNNARLVLSGTAYPRGGFKNGDKHYRPPTDAFAEYLQWETEQYIQDNFDIIQEASKATKTRRMKKKILRRVNADEKGYGEISDGHGNEVPVRIKFGTDHQTHTNREWDVKKQTRLNTIRINNNDMRRDNSIPVFQHEKNHIVIDTRNGPAASKVGQREANYNDRTYHDVTDVQDSKLIKAFISKHESELKSDHAKMPDEYLSDLISAREIGYNKMIRTLEDLRIDVQKMSPSAKKQKARLKANAMIDRNEEVPKDERWYLIWDYIRSYKDAKKEYEDGIKYNHSPEAIAYAKAKMNAGENLFDNLPDFHRNKTREQDETFIKCYEKNIEEYTNDLKYRILFLKEMNKYDHAKKKNKNVVSESHIITLRDPLEELINQNNPAYTPKTVEAKSYAHYVISEYINGFIDKSFYTESELNAMVDDIVSYIVFEELESDVLNDIYCETSIITDEELDVWQEFKFDMMAYLDNPYDGDIVQDSRIERVNDEGVPVPEKCPECGADVGIFLKGEPVWLCKKCHKYFGTVPCNIQESKLPTSKRKKLKDSDFGIPEKRTFPLNDRAHVEAAVRMFPHADNKDKEQLAKRILRKAHEFGIDTSGWDSINKFVQESFDEVSVEVPYATATAGVRVPEVEKTEINPFVSFDKVPLNDYIIDRYKDKTDDMALGLKHLHLPEESIGFLWLNQNDDVVGYVATNKSDIIGIELSPKYQHKGLGRALLDFATDYLGGRRIAVSKHNENAYNMLNHCGWCKYDETPNMNMLMIGEDVPDDHIQEAALLPSGVTLRPATDADIPRITTYTLDELAPEFRENKSIVDEVKKNAVDAVKKTRVIMYNGEPVGMLTGFYVKGGYWYIGIHLEEGCRGKGIGTAILKREISRHDKLSLDVFKTNTGAIKLYKSLGFKVVHETEYAYAMTLEKNNKESDSNAT